jgi:thiamine-phosphate pyrophosphorylase
LLLARNVLKDPGADFSTSEELLRSQPEEVLLAEFKRAEEASRVLEELTKVFNRKWSAFFKKFRFELYSLEKKLFFCWERKNRLNFKLYLVLDGDFSEPAEVLKIAKKAVQAGIKIIQLRAKKLGVSEFLALAQKIKKITSGRSLFIINDRVDLALAVGADGVHLGPEDLPVEAARRILGESGLIGFSAATVIAARRAAQKGADYLGVGAFFATPVKPELKTVSVKKFLKIQKAVRLPVVAIGGINPDNLSPLVKAGVRKIAVVRALAEPVSFDKNLCRFKKIFGGKL